MGDSGDSRGVTEARLRYAFLATGLSWFVAVFTAYRLFERPGLGIGHLYYIGIVLVAVAGGAYVGALAGLLATAFYAVGVFWNPHIDVATLPTVATGIRLVSYVLIGSMVGYYAARSRTLLARADELTEELKILARRDVVTGLPNQRGFQMAITERIDRGAAFCLVVCQVPEPPSGLAGADWLLRIGERLTYSVEGSHVSRITDHQFAVLGTVGDFASARALTADVETALREFSRPVAGWSGVPQRRHGCIDALHRGQRANVRARCRPRAIRSGHLTARVLRHAPWPPYVGGEGRLPAHERASTDRDRAEEAVLLA